jgi:hypothetical protein
VETIVESSAASSITSTSPLKAIRTWRGCSGAGVAEVSIAGIARRLCKSRAHDAATRALFYRKTDSATSCADIAKADAIAAQPVSRATRAPFATRRSAAIATVMTAIMGMFISPTTSKVAIAGAQLRLHLTPSEQPSRHSPMAVRAPPVPERRRN